MRVFERGTCGRSRRRETVLACVLACCLLAVTGCGGSGHKHAASGSSSQPATSTTTASSTPSLKSGVGSVDAYLTQNLIHVQLTLFDVRRSGSAAIVDFGMACRDARGCEIQQAFEDRAAYEGKSGSCQGPPCGSNAGGLLLIDPSGNREYGVVRDSQGNPYASTLSLGLTEGGQPRLAFAVFPQLPAGVSSIDVAFPQGGPVFLNVPVTSGPAPKPATAGTGVQAAAGAEQYSGPANSVAGVTLPESPLSLTVGSPAGSDREGGDTATFTLHSDVLFAFNKSNLSSRAHRILSGLARQIKARAAGTVQVTGYTDSIGSDAVNLPLSRARAAAVVAALKPLTPGTSYRSAGKGSADPVAPNTTSTGADYPPGRALNRRVTIVVPVRAPAKPSPPPAPAATAAATSPSASPVTYSPGGQSSPNSYTVAPVGLHRDGNLVVLNLDATCHGNDCSPGFDFGGVTSVPPLSLASLAGKQAAFLHGGQFTDNVPSGVYLTDPRTGDIYTAVTDNGAVTDHAAYPLTSQAGPGGSDGGTTPMWLYFAAPPAGSSTMTVHMPGGSPTMTLPVTALNGLTVTH